MRNLNYKGLKIWPIPLFLNIYFIYRYNIEVDEEQIYIQQFAWGLPVVCRLDVGLKLGFIGAVLMRL